MKSESLAGTRLYQKPTVREAHSHLAPSANARISDTSPFDNNESGGYKTLMILVNRARCQHGGRNDSESKGRPYV